MKMRVPRLGPLNQCAFRRDLRQWRGAGHTLALSLSRHCRALLACRVPRRRRRRRRRSQIASVVDLSASIFSRGTARRGGEGRTEPEKEKLSERRLPPSPLSFFTYLASIVPSITAAAAPSLFPLHISAATAPSFEYYTHSSPLLSSPLLSFRPSE